MPLNDADTPCPLYFVHSISGELTSLHELVRQLGPARRIYGVQVPQDRLGGAFAQSIETIAAHYVELIEAFQPDGPLMLGGWSAGAVIALEMAQRLRARGREIVLLVAFDGLLYNTAADLTWRGPRLYVKFALNLARRLRVTLGSRWDLRGIGKRIVRETRRVAAGLRHSSPSDGPGKGLDMYLDPTGWPADQEAFARGLYDAAMAYAPARYDGRVVLYAARIRPLFALSPVLEAWRSVAPAIDAIEVGGTHTNILHLPQVTGVAQDLRRRLAAFPLPDRA